MAAIRQGWESPGVWSTCGNTGHLWRHSRWTEEMDMMACKQPGTLNLINWGGPAKPLLRVILPHTKQCRPTEFLFGNCLTTPMS